MRIPSLAGKPLALGFGAAFLVAASLYPFDKTWWLAPILLLYSALLVWRPRLWLGALPALLPALDLAPWSGWFFFEEIDLLLLITAAFGYWRLARTPPQARLPGFALACVSALSLAYLIGAARGLTPFVHADANALSNYLSPYNSLRIGKAWFWALVLLPLLTRDAGAALTDIRRHFLPGMLAGLALVSIAAGWERMLFPGLMNFSSDYRSSAPFSGMHTGGAALDGYLALCFPLVGTWLLTRQSRMRTGTAIALLALGGYAGLSTFSRGLFAAYACSAAIIGLFLLGAARKARPALDWRHALAAVLATALLADALARVFASSGYRGLAAALTLLAAAFVTASLPIPRAVLATSVVCGISVELALATLLALAGPVASGALKPPYLLFLLSAAPFAGLAWRARGAVWPPERAGVSVALIAFSCLAFNTLWIAEHWGGPAARGPAALIIALALLPLALNLALRRAPWRIGHGGATLVAAGAILAMLAIPIGAGYYTGERFAGVGADWQTRARHWRQALAMMDDDALTHAVGMGLGKFPVTYFWRNPLRETPATIGYLDEGSNRYLRLGAPSYAAGYGEVLRILQRVALRPATRYRLELDVRSSARQPRLNINLCQRLLLYPQHCVNAPLHLLPPDGAWQHYRIDIDSASLGAGPWPLRAPTQLELAAEGGATLDIDNLSLRAEPAGPELIANGAFSGANDYWFFSSDRHHLPWHVKNFALNLYFELGALGLGTLGTLLAFALLDLSARARRAEPDAAVWLAALAGFLVIGLFDSLLDVPRLALLFFLVLLCALLRPACAPATACHPGRPPKELYHA